MSRPDLALLVLPLAGAGLALAHGWGKLSRLAAGQGGGFVDGVASLGFPMPGFFAWAAALSEFAGGLAVALGLWTRAAAGLAACTMAVAAFLRHHAHQHLLAWLGLISVSGDTLEAWGDPEKALLYLLILAALTLTGGGRISLDARLRGKRP